MCGIAGITGKPGGDVLHAVPAVSRSLAHRGPDDCGYLWCAGSEVRVDREWHPPSCPADAVLVHRRLSILDLTDSGWQPMRSRDGRYFIVYNGEIYNYLELRAELERLEHHFQSRSDTEVLLAAYAQWGAQALPRLVGMFAFAVLDLHRRMLFLARDFVGIKPLYYTLQKDCLAFASEIKALLEFGVASRRPNVEKLYLYLRHGICDYGPVTIFADIFQVPPAHYLEVSLDEPSRAQPVCYWRPADGEELDISFEAAARHLRELFLTQVRLHLRSDVPVGVALSGGIDSSAIVMAMRQLDSSLDIHAFSYIADDPAVSEERWVDVVGRAARAQIHKTSPGPEDLAADLPALITAQDQPFGSTSLYAQYRVFAAARAAGIKVMLDGQGADELFGGYRFYMAARLASLLRQNQWQQAIAFLIRCSRWPGVRKSWLLFRCMDFLLPLSMQIPLRKLIAKELMPAWVRNEWFQERGFSPQLLNSVRGPDVLRAILRRTLTTTTLPGLLRYEDRNSMAFSIESRVPFLTPEMVNFVLALPEEYIIARDGTPKAVFRQAMRGLVPDKILDRRDKIGFATPEARWLRHLNGWVEGTLDGAGEAELPFLKLDVLRREWSLMSTGRRPVSPSVWRWLNLVPWSRQFQVQYD